MSLRQAGRGPLRLSTEAQAATPAGLPLAVVAGGSYLCRWCWWHSRFSTVDPNKTVAMVTQEGLGLRSKVPSMATGVKAWVVRRPAHYPNA